MAQTRRPSERPGRGKGQRRHDPPPSRSRITSSRRTVPIGCARPFHPDEVRPIKKRRARLGHGRAGGQARKAVRHRAGPGERAEAHDLGLGHGAGEFANVVGRGVQDEFLGRAALLDPAVLHDGDAVGKPDRLVEIMGDEDDGLAKPRLQADEFVLQLAPDQRVERREGFVEKPELRLDRQRACDAHALLLAARKLARKGGLAPRKAHQPDHLARPHLAPLAIDTLHLQREGHVVEHGKVRQEREVLKDHAHLVTPYLRHLGLGCGEQVLAVEQYLARRRLDQSRQAAHQRGLARTGQAHDDEDLAAPNAQVHGADGGNEAPGDQQFGVGTWPERGQMFGGARPEDLPDVTADEGVFGVGHRWPWLKMRAGIIRPAIAPEGNGPTWRSTCSSGLHWPPSSRPPRRRSLCRSGRPR